MGRASATLFPNEDWGPSRSHRRNYWRARSRESRQAQVTKKLNTLPGSQMSELGMLLCQSPPSLLCCVPVARIELARELSIMVLHNREIGVVVALLDRCTNPPPPHLPPCTNACADVGLNALHTSSVNIHPIQLATTPRDRRIELFYEKVCMGWDKYAEGMRLAEIPSGERTRTHGGREQSTSEVDSAGTICG